jgi:hypothetical protein
MIEPSLQLGGGNWANKSDKLLGYHKDGANFYADELTFSRNSLASYTDANGLIQSMPYNLLTYSEDLSNAIWTKEAGNSITTNSTTAPNGTTTADTISATAGNELNTYQIITTKLGVYNYSSYVKKGATNLVLTYIYQTGVGFKAKGQINFDAETFTASLGTGTIESVGDGWFRVSLSVNLLAAEHSFGFYTESTTGTRSVYAWGAQANIGSTALPYFPTTTRLNLARVDYKDNINGSLLLEPQRTNLVTYSEDFSNAAWTKSGATITANATTSPDGTTNSDSFIGNGSNAEHSILQSLSFIGGTTYTISFYAKKNTNNFIQVVGASSAFGANVWANFDLNSGVVGSVGSSTTAKIQNVGDGWYRCTAIAAAIATTSTNIVMFLINSSTSSRAESNSLSTSVYLYGAQTESGSYSTSYIKSEGAATTRLADSCSKTGISDKIGQTQGTMFMDVDLTHSNASGTNQYLMQLYLDAGARIILFRTSANELNFYFLKGVTAFFSITSITANGRHKLAFAYKSGDSTFYIDGVQIETNSSPFSAFSSLNELHIGANFNPTQAEIGDYSYNQAIVFPTRLTNAELATLTTL